MKKYICPTQALGCDGCAMKGMGCNLIESDEEEPEEEDGTTGGGDDVFSELGRGGGGFF